MTTLQQQLAEAATKQITRNTDQIFEMLRKSALEQASLGYMQLYYKVDKPVNWLEIKKRFEQQHIKTEINTMTNVIGLSWHSNA